MSRPALMLQLVNGRHVTLLNIFGALNDVGAVNLENYSVLTMFPGKVQAGLGRHRESQDTKPEDDRRC